MKTIAIVCLALCAMQSFAILDGLMGGIGAAKEAAGLAQQLFKREKKTEVQVMKSDGGYTAVSVDCDQTTISFPEANFPRWIKWAMSPNGFIARSVPLAQRFLNVIAEAEFTGAMIERKEDMDFGVTDGQGKMTFVHLDFQVVNGRVSHFRNICKIQMKLAPDLFIWTRSKSSFFSSKSEQSIQKEARAFQMSELASFDRFLKRGPGAPTSQV